MQDQKRVNVDFPAWMIVPLDKETGRINVTRQSIIKYGWRSVWKSWLPTKHYDEQAAEYSIRHFRG